MYDKYLNKLESLLDTKLEKTEKVNLAFTIKQAGMFKEQVVEYTKSIEKFGKEKERIEDTLSELTRDGNASFKNLKAAQKEIEPAIKDFGIPMPNELKGIDQILKDYSNTVKKYD